MEENEDKSIIKSPVVEMDGVDSQEFKVANECDVVIDKSAEFECGVDGSKPADEAEGIISASGVISADCGVGGDGAVATEEKIASSPGGGREVGETIESGIELVVEERDDDLSGDKEVSVVGVDVCETDGRHDESDVKDVGDTKVEAVDEDKGEDVLEGKDDNKSVSAEVEVDTIDELEVNNECEVANQSEVKPDVAEEKLGVRVVCEVLPGREMKEELGVGEVDRSACEAVGDACEVNCRIGTEVEVGCEVEDKVEADSEDGTDMKLISESDKGLDVVVEEKVVMESVASESVKEAEEVVEKSEDNLEYSSGVNVAEDMAVEHQNLVLETKCQKKDEDMEKKDEGMVSVPDFGDEEDEMETEREGDEDKVKGMVSQPDDDSQLAEDEEEERIAEDEPVADIEMETENDAGDAAKISGGKRKRGKNTKAAGKAQLRNMGLPVQEEDVCFVCFDGGDLVLCDRKNCPKAYHPSCVNRDENYFQAKGRWNCGWHQCSHTNCQKNAYYMCYTCTFSLCKGCIKDAVILCVRGNKGFCETCINIVTMIEDNTAQGNQAQIDFDDKSSWEYLFKDYWVDLKEKLSITPVEIAQAKNPWKGSDAGAGKHGSPVVQFDMKDGGGSDNASDNPEASKPKKRKYKKRLKSRAKQDELTNESFEAGAEGTSTPKSTEWASKELLEFVMHMKDGDRTVLSQFDVQALLLEYIKINKLRDPRRKSQIICDPRLENIFGKARVGHFEMLKLLESHFYMKEDTQIDDVQGTVVDTETNHLDADGNPDSLTKGGKDKKRKTRKKDGRGRQSNLDDYAAIDNHNISLIYLRRKLMEDLLEDSETFTDKVVGTFVRIRISGSNQKQDIYRLVQVIGTSNVDELYKVGKRTTNIMLEILNLNKTEVISIDSISNQDFTEDECKRLRQSIKCGLINRLTVGDILDKALEVQVARVNDWLESEVQRLIHLRDRASDLGKKKQLRECVESLLLLETPEERRRRLEDTPEIHADPKMDPNFESEDDDSENDSNKQEMYTRARGSGFSRRGREPISPGSGDVKDSWSSGRKNSGKGWEFNRHLTNKNIANKVDDSPINIGISTDNSWNLGRGSETEKPSIVEKPTSATSSEAFGLNRKSAAGSESFNHVESKNSPASLTAPVATASMNFSETDKMWHYQDPHGKVQGPFSMVQLRKWSNTGYFPADLRIWSTSGNKDESLLLTDALAGKFQKELPPVDNGIPKSNILQNPHLPSPQSARSFESPLHQGREIQDREILNPNQNHVTMDSHTNSASRNWAANSIEIPLLSAERASSNHSGRNNLANFPSPTPKQNSAGEVGRPTVTVSIPGSIEALQAPAVATPDSTRNLTPISERGFPSSHSAFGASSNPEQGSLVGLTDFLQNTQSNAAAQLQGAQSLNQPFNTPETSANIVPGHNPALGTQGWGNAPTQSVEANSSNQTSSQQSAYTQWTGPTQSVEANSSNQTSSQQSTYAQWTGVQSTSVQNPATNLPMQGASHLPNTWRPPIQNNQSNMQPNLQWNMGIAENSAPAQNLQLENPNSSWGPVQAIPNMGWAGPNLNMNWVPSVQGSQPGNMSAGWVMPSGNPVAGFQGAVPGNLNQGWVAQPGNPGGMMQMLGTMNANPGWFPNIAPNVQGAVPGNGNSGMTTASTTNLGPNAQGQMPGNANSGWSTSSGNTNQGWGPPAGNQGNNRSEHPRNNGDKFSGQKDQGSQHGRNWNKQSSFGGGGGSRLGSRGICYQFQDTGHCKRGDSCNFRHSS